MPENEQERPQLTASMVGMIMKCGPQFIRRFGDRFGIWPEAEIIPPNQSLILGKSVHKATESLLRKKMQDELYDSIVAVAEAGDIARDNVVGEFSGEVYFPGKSRIEISQIRDESIDIATNLVTVYSAEVVPIVSPSYIEYPFVLLLKNFDFDLSGQIDLVEGTSVRDTKTTGSNPGKFAVITPQSAIYSLWYYNKYKSLPTSIVYDYLKYYRGKNNISYSYKEIGALPSKKWIEPVYRRIEQIAETISLCQRGKVDPLNAWSPADSTSWVCTAKYCGYHSTCKFWSGREE